VHEAAGDARDEEAVVDLQFYGVLEGLLGYAEHAVELLGLGYCAGEAVEDESGGGVVLACAQQLCRRGDAPLGALGVVLELRLDHVDHDLVANQTTRVHDLLCFPAERSLCRDLRAQHVSGSLQSVSPHVSYPTDSEKPTRWQAQNFSLILGA